MTFESRVDEFDPGDNANGMNMPTAKPVERRKIRETLRFKEKHGCREHVKG